LTRTPRGSSKAAARAKPSSAGANNSALIILYAAKLAGFGGPCIGADGRGAQHTLTSRSRSRLISVFSDS
jgi:hypothetical protein